MYLRWQRFAVAKIQCAKTQMYVGFVLVRFTAVVGVIVFGVEGGSVKV